jgi:hypothetical protein
VDKGCARKQQRAGGGSADCRANANASADVARPPQLAAAHRAYPGTDGDEDDGDADDDDDDDDEEVDGDVSRVGRILSTRPTRGVNYVGHDAAVDKKGGAELLRQALAELVVLRRRYAHLDELSPVFTALDQLAHAATEPEQSRRSSATKFARELIDREGMELQTAASRASEAYGVDRWEVLEALRSRAAG